MFGLFRKNVSKHSAKSSKVTSHIEGLESREMFASGPTIFAADSHGKLFKLNLGNGATSSIGNMSVVMYDIAVNKSTGQMYGIDSRSNLYKINKTNAVVTKVGALGRFANALVFSSGGTLYAAGYGKFMKVNTSTGASTVIGNLGGSYNSAGDLAFDGSGKLYLTTTSNKLVRVNTSTGAASLVGSLNFNQAYGLGYYNGVMYGISNANEKAYKINLTTGAGTYVSYFGTNVIGANGASF